MSALAKLLAALSAGGAAAFGYGLIEPYLYRLQVHELPVGPRSPALDILHISDTHLSAKSGRLQRFLRSLPNRLEATPDLVVATGDMIDGPEAVAPLVESLDSLEANLGRFFVLGSHDYYASAGPTYTKYFSKNKTISRAKELEPDLLARALGQQGWISLTNRSEEVAVGDRRVRLSGVDDPYLDRHRVDHLERSSSDDLAIGVMHSPDVVSEFALTGFDLLLAGHTHGGQVRFPVLGAAVTNSSLPTALAAGPHRVGNTWLHVSPGLGTGRYSPIRFLTRPEATLLRLVPEG